MTRTEFDENVCSWADLIDFCYENNMSNVDDILSSDSMDEYIWEEIHDFTGSWESLRDYLDDIRTGYEYYRRDGWLDYVYMDDEDFMRYKGEVANEAEEHGYFTSEEEEVDGEDATSEELRRRLGYYFTDPLTGEVLIAGMPIEPICVGEIDSLFQ